MSFGEDLFEPDVKNILENGRKSDYGNAFDWLANSSNVNLLRETENDIVEATKVTSKRTMSLRGLSFSPTDSRRNSILLERRFTSLSDLSKNIMLSVSSLLEKIDSFNFDLFELDNLIGEKTLHYMAYEIFERFNFFDQLIDDDKYKSFIKQIISGYNRSVVYHNDLHAADVMQTVFVMIEKGDLIAKLKLSDIDVLACLLSAICHDFKHNGYNNNYHVNAKSPIAIKYNDSSVLENFHVAESFKIMMKEENNLLCKLKPEEWRLVRRRMIDCILSTDMANHAKHLNTMKAKLDTFDIKNGKNVDRMIFLDNVSRTYENQQMVLGMCVHTADVSNPAKPQEVNKKWVDLVFQEFFNQGDIERTNGLPISLLCDRETTNINKSQIGFINFVVIPTFETLMNVIPEITPYMTVVKENLHRYDSLVKESEKK